MIFENSSSIKRGTKLKLAFAHCCGLAFVLLDMEVYIL
jgi:hypothetical protein